MQATEPTAGQLAVVVGQFVAVKSAVYKEKPLIGKVVSVATTTVVIEWWMGTYSGLWREWVGKENGKKVVYTDNIEKKDIIDIDIKFTKSKRLPPCLVRELKSLY